MSQASLAYVGQEAALLLALIHVRSFAEPWSEDSFSTLLGSPGVKGLVAGEGAGFILWRTVVDEAEILTLVVDPNFRHQGLGTLLVNNALESAKALGVVRFFLEVEEGNQAAMTLYGNCGFIRIGNRLDYYGPGRSAILMERKLFL
jgi:ribosomal-protein-alanine N-acetyltransferase